MSDSRRTLELSIEDIGRLIVLASSLDPEDWSDPEIGSLIYLCKAHVSSRHIKGRKYEYGLDATIVVKGVGQSG